MKLSNMAHSNTHWHFFLTAAWGAMLSLASLAVGADESGHQHPAANKPILSQKAKAKANPKKLDRNFVSFGIALNEFRSIELVLSEVAPDRRGNLVETEQQRNFPLVAQTYGASIAVGTYIADNFRTELRYATGIRKDTLDNALDININYVFSWYFGVTQAVTDYMSAYALYGISYYDADVTRRQVSKLVGDLSQGQVPVAKVLQPSTVEMEKGLFGTRFSSTWMLGLDFNVADSWHWAFEYGQLINDTNSNIKVYQAGTYLRYDY